MTFIRMAMFVILSSVGLTANAAYINFDDYSINKVANQGADGSASTNAFGLELGLDGNTWVFINDTFSIDASSVLYYTFEAPGNEAEWYGIGFDNDNSVTASSLFQFGGVDTTGANQLSAYSFGSGLVSYAVNVGDYLSGVFSQMVFVLDADNVSGASASFINVELCSTGDFCETTAQSNVSVDTPSTAILFALSLCLICAGYRRI